MLFCVIAGLSFGAGVGAILGVAIGDIREKRYSNLPFDVLITLLLTGCVYAMGQMIFAQQVWTLEVYAASVFVGMITPVVAFEQEHIRCFVALLLIRYATTGRIRAFWLRQFVAWLIWNIAPRQKLVELMGAAQ